MNDFDKFDKWSLAIVVILVFAAFFTLAFISGQRMENVIEEVGKFYG